MMNEQNQSGAMTQFARMWSAGMAPIIAESGGWPGFRYTADEQGRMNNIAEGVSSNQFFAFLFINATVTIIAFIPFVLIMFGGLLALYGDDPSKTPAAVFFIALALTCASAIGIGVPLGMLVGSWITSKIYPPDPSDLPDPDFARRLFMKVTFQVMRVAAAVGVAMFFIWMFVPEDSKVVVFLNLILPILGPLVSLMTLVYYYGNRLSKRTTSRRSD